MSVEIDNDLTILEAARLLNIDIPTFCHDDRLNPTGSCRMCVVEVEGARNLMTACSTKVRDGMVVRTNTKNVVETRKGILELMWANHPNECLVCEKSGECKLQDYSYQYNVNPDSIFKPLNSRDFIDNSNEFYTFDSRKCILCGKCVQICSELQMTSAIGFDERGIDTHIKIKQHDDSIDGVIDLYKCVSCGNCVNNCPVGALMPKTKDKYRNWEVDKIKTTCPYCGVGCQFNLVVKDNKVVRVEPVKGGTNDGLLCVKGSFGYKFINHPDRLKQPLIKKDGVFVESTWEEAMDLIVKKINETKAKHGPNAFSGLSSAKCTNEENYLMQKLVRAGFGTNNVDHCARLCHASTVAGLATTLGSGAMTNSISEIGGTDTFLVIGSNTTETHPVIGVMIKQRVKKGAKLIVADPRKIELANMANVHLQIKPGTNVALANGLMNVIYNEGLYDKEFINKNTNNLEDLLEVIKEYTPEKAAEICGVSKEDIVKAARLYASADRAAIYYAMGITQHSSGTNHVKSMANLALMTGNVGKESTGINPLRGQNNVQGACDMGALPDVLPGYQKVFDDAVAKKYEKAWGVSLSREVGHTLPIMMNEASSQDIKFMYIMGENPVVSDPDTNHIKKALTNLDFLVVQDIFLTQTAEFADVVLPAASYAEKDGTFTNTERRVQRIRKAVTIKGNARSDWEILSELLTRLGLEANYNNAEDIFKEMASLTPIYAGLDYDRIDDNGMQWPCPTSNHPGTKYLYKDGFTKLGKAIFTPIEHLGPQELPDSEYPLILTTGRTLYHFHTKTMTDRVEGLKATVPDNFIQVSPDTAKQYQLKHNEFITVSSRRGSSVAKVQITDTIDDGVVFMPFHFADGANMLTNPALDDICNIPEFKVCAVKVNKC